jgi:hypothetical protein
VLGIDRIVRLWGVTIKPIEETEYEIYFAGWMPGR